MRRSRFVTSIGPSPSTEDARAFVGHVSAGMPDATHHCWAFLAEWDAPPHQCPLAGGGGLELTADVPVDQVERLRAEVAHNTSGAGRVELPAPAPSAQEVA